MATRTSVKRSTDPNAPAVIETHVDPYKRDSKPLVKTSDDPSQDFDRIHGNDLDRWKEATNQTLLNELALAKRQAAGKLGFALSSGPGTSGLAVAAENALDRQFAALRASGLNETNKYAAQFKLNWNMATEKWGRDVAMAKLQFQQQQMYLQQQAELNSASWWEQLGGVVGFAVGQAVEWFKPPTVVYGGGYK